MKNIIFANILKRNKIGVHHSLMNKVKNMKHRSTNAKRASMAALFHDSPAIFTSSVRLCNSRDL